MIGALDKGLLLEDVKRMDLGNLIDFIIDYNSKYERTTEPEQPKTRKATQQDWDRFWG